MIESPDILAKLKDLVDKGSRMAGAIDRSLVSRTRALELIDMLMESLPDEIEQARKIVRDRESILETARRQAGEIIDEAVRKAEKLVDADEITEQARERSREMEEDSNKYIMGRLLDLEEELKRLLTEVRGGIRVLGESNSPHDRNEGGFSLDKM
jgi:hypothetical protein